MTSQILLYHNAYNMYQILYMMTNIYVHHVTSDENQLYHIMLGMQT